MRAGTFRHQLVIQQRADVQNTSGEPIPAWTTFVTVTASVEPLQGHELIAAQQIVASVSHRIIMRYLTGIVPSMRVSYNGRYFDINTVINVDELGRELNLLCTERVGQD